MALPKETNRKVQAERDKLFTLASLFSIPTDCNDKNLYSLNCIPG